MKSTRTSATVAAYVPGVCNINHAEIARRRMVGIVGVIIFGVIAVDLVTLSISHWWRLILAIPAFIAAVGLLQARSKFCVGYGSAGLQNADEGSATAAAVTDTTALGKDKQKARQINLQSACIALVITLLTLFIPSF